MAHGGGGIDIGAAFSGGHGVSSGPGISAGQGWGAGHGMGNSTGDQGAVDGARRYNVRGLDSDAISDTLMLSYDHGSAWRGGQPGYDLVDSVHGSLEQDLYKATGPDRPAHRRELTPEQIEIVKRLADDPERAFFGIHVIHHGKVDLQREFAKLAQANGCHRVDGFMPNFFGEDATQDELADWNRWTPPYTRKRVPASWYPTATGFTHVWKQYWQLIRKPKWYDKYLIDSSPVPFPKEGMRFDVYVNTVLEVTGVTWYFREMGDFETRFHIKVITLPYLDPQDKQWGILLEPFKRYQKAARTISEAMLKRMKTCPPEPITFEYRKQLFEELRAKYGPKVEELRAARALEKSVKDAMAGSGAADHSTSGKLSTGAQNPGPSAPPSTDPPAPADCLSHSGSDLLTALSGPKEKRAMSTVIVSLPLRPGART